MSINELSIAKSTLAKLLAGENINVVHKRISTAMFDLKTRTLYVPIWEDMSGELYDLLMGHEVGHALNTPTEGWHSATHDAEGKFLGAFKDVLNICEDARIEKMIKRTYPGISKSFVAGYKTLFDRDFFGIKKLKDYSKLNILDRINLYAKCGSFLVVPFNDDERALVREVENTETWEQVVAVSHKLFALAKKNQDQQLNDLDDLTEELMKQFKEEMGEDGEESEPMPLDLSDDSDDSDEITGSTSESEEGEDEEADASASASGEESEEDEEEEEDATGGGSPTDDESDEDSEEESQGGEGDDDSEESDESTEDALGGNEQGGEETPTPQSDPESITDRSFRSRERDLVADGVEVYTYNLPRPELDRIIVPNRVFVENFFAQIATAQKTYGNRDPIAATCAKRFTDNNSRYINLLVKEFEMRKNASQYARTSTAKTGELDMSKLHKYKYSNDIFKKIAVVQKGKSHGMIMYVDMSGSMDSCFGATMEQTLILVSFCRKVGIPFDVYGFSDRREFLLNMITAGKLGHGFVSNKFTKTGNDKYSITDTGFHLIHFISSQLQGNAYRRAYEAMAVVAMNYKNVMYPRVHMPYSLMGIELGGTPFTQTLMASRPMIEKFKVDNKVDITNVIYLTDGDGTGCFSFTEIPATRYDYATGKPKIEQIIYMIDQKTKRRVEFNVSGMSHNTHQTAMTQFVRQVTGCKHIGFYITDSRSARATITARHEMTAVEQTEMDKQWRKHGYYSAPTIGYDMYYYVRSADLGARDQDYTLTEDMSAKKIAKVFTESQDDKRKHRILVSKFAQDIAA